MIIDISLPLSPNMPTWPGSQRFQQTWIKRLESKDNVNESKICCNMHTGTHIDAPLHHISSGKSVDQLNLANFFGPAYVIDLTGVNEITSHDLIHSNIPLGTQRLLFKTNNSGCWHTLGAKFNENFVALTDSAAEWIVENNILLVGIDSLSIEKYNTGSTVHKRMLIADIIILEGLNLNSVKEGSYILNCLPMNIVGAEGAPARAILIKN